MVEPLNSGASAAADQALVSDQARAGLDPSGFDPSRMEWVKQGLRYTHGWDLRVGGVTLGSVGYDGVSSKAVTDRYIAGTRLPGFKLRRDRFASERDAMAALGRFTLAWFTKMLSRDSDRSGEASETQSGSTVGESADPKGIAQPHSGNHPND